jgi:hypothetical protein
MKAKEWFKEAERFVRSYTEGMRESEFSRLFERDAARAFDVVTREHDREKEPKDEFWRFLHRVRIFFLGLSFKLSPPRRLLFAICIVLALIGLVGIDIDNFITVRNAIAFSLSIAGLVLLLVLELADRVVVRDELEVARELQRELLPRAAPPVPGYDFAFSYRTANTIGGDYYDFLVLDDGRLVVVMGDASGHGISAGLLMAIANSALKSFARGIPSRSCAAPMAVSPSWARGRYRWVSAWSSSCHSTRRSSTLATPCSSTPMAWSKRSTPPGSPSVSTASARGWRRVDRAGRCTIEYWPGSIDSAPRNRSTTIAVWWSCAAKAAEIIRSDQVLTGFSAVRDCFRFRRPRMRRAVSNT